MPDEIYEVISQGARYWFLFLMVLIVWRSYRWLARDRKQRRKRLRLLPDAGYVGELVVLAGSAELPEGLALPVSGEGVLGSLRGDDVYVPVRGVQRKHLWYSFDEDYGLRVEPYGRHTVTVDGQTLRGRRSHAWLLHGSRLTVGESELRLRMFAGFEGAGVYRAPEAEEAELAIDTQAAVTPAAPQTTTFTPQQLALLQQMQQMQQMQWMAAWQAAQAQNGIPAGMGTMPVTPGAPFGASAAAGGVAAQPNVTPMGQPAISSGPEAAVLSTAEGDFLAPGKTAAQGSILASVGATGDAESATGDAQSPMRTSDGVSARKKRANPLPPLDPAEDTESGAPLEHQAPDADTAGNATLYPTETRIQPTQTPDELWSRMHNRTNDAVFRSSPEDAPGFAVSGSDATFAPPGDNATFAPMVTFYPPEMDEGALFAAEPQDDPLTAYVADTDAADGEWPRVPYPQSDAHFTDSGYTYPEYVEPGEDAPYEYADEDEAPRSLYVEPDEAAQAKRLLWDRYLKGGRRK